MVIAILLFLVLIPFCHIFGTAQVIGRILQGICLLPFIFGAYLLVVL